MKLTQQGDTRQAQRLLGIIHEKLSNKRKRAAAAAASVPVAIVHDDDPEHIQTSPTPTDTSHASVSHPYGDSQPSSQVSPCEFEQSVSGDECEVALHSDRLSTVVLERLPECALLFVSTAAPSSATAALA